MELTKDEKGRKGERNELHPLNTISLSSHMHIRACTHTHPYSYTGSQSSAKVDYGQHTKTKSGS